MSRIIPPAWFLMALLAMLVLHFGVPVVRLLPLPWNLSGLALLPAGVFVAAWGNLRFRAHATPVFPGAPATALVTDGPFRFSRNPMYLGMALILLGTGLLLGTLGPLPVVPLFMLLIWRKFIVHEQRLMGESFGEAYEAYLSRVRMWL